MHIEFDASKNQVNIRERSLSFEQALNFDFGTAVIDQDTRKTYPEVRFVAVGFLGKRFACAVLYSSSWWHSCHQLSQGQHQRVKKL